MTVKEFMNYVKMHHIPEDAELAVQAVGGGTEPISDAIYYDQAKEVVML